MVHLTTGGTNISHLCHFQQPTELFEAQKEQPLEVLTKISQDIKSAPSLFNLGLARHSDDMAATKSNKFAWHVWKPVAFGLDG
jgi:hypothetical protein